MVEVSFRILSSRYSANPSAINCPSLVAAPFITIFVAGFFYLSLELIYSLPEAFTVGRLGLFFEKPFLFLA